MSKHIPAEQFATVSQTARPIPRGQYGRTFDLHPAIFALTFSAYIAYLGILALTFAEADADIAIPFVIFAIFVVAGFGTPALWARIAPPPAGEAPSWATFMREGFECLTGHVSAKGAMVQVLIMPTMLLFWALAVTIIVASVR